MLDHDFLNSLMQADSILLWPQGFLISAGLLIFILWRERHFKSEMAAQQRKSMEEMAAIQRQLDIAVQAFQESHGAVLSSHDFPNSLDVPRID
jgi:hypothetical protein